MRFGSHWHQEEESGDNSCEWSRFRSTSPPLDIQTDTTGNGMTSLIKPGSLCNKGLFVWVTGYLRTKYAFSLFSWRFVVFCTMITQYALHQSVSDSLWYHPWILLKQLFKRQHDKAATLVDVHMHSCDSLQSNSVKSGSNQSGRNVTPHLYWWTLCNRCSAALSDHCVWHGNYFQIPQWAAKNCRKLGWREKQGGHLKS